MAPPSTGLGKCFTLNLNERHPLVHNATQSVANEAHTYMNNDDLYLQRTNSSHSQSGCCLLQNGRKRILSKLLRWD